jgi:hypothetical protein
MWSPSILSTARRFQMQQQHVLEQAIEVLTITIPFPSHIPRARGIHAVGKFGTVLKAKCSRDEEEAVQAAADKLGLTKSEFIRWCSVYSAREIMK